MNTVRKPLIMKWEKQKYLATAPGQIQRLSAAVMIDETAETRSVIAQVTTVAMFAFGIDNNRGIALVSSWFLLIAVGKRN